MDIVDNLVKNLSHPFPLALLLARRWVGLKHMRKISNGWLLRRIFRHTIHSFGHLIFDLIIHCLPSSGYGAVGISGAEAASGYTTGADGMLIAIAETDIGC